MAASQGGANTVKHAASNSGFELLERLGYVVRGLLYAVMGLLVLRIALGVSGGQATDLQGSLVYLIGNPFGKLVLIVVIVGLAAYSLWRFIRAIYDPLHRGSNASGYAARLGFVTSALSYLAIVFFALQILSGAATTSGDSTQKTIASILTHPAGGWLTIIIGLAAVGVAIGQFIESYRAIFARDLKGSEMTASERNIAVKLGRFGMFARGVTFLIIGWFLIQAGMHNDASQVQGFGGAFLFLLSQPYGHILVGIIGLGFVALGLHSFACARWVRLMGSSG